MIVIAKICEHQQNISITKRKNVWLLQSDRFLIDLIANFNSKS